MHGDADPPAGENDRVPQCTATLRELGDVVFLPCNKGDGGKGPILSGYPSLTTARMTPEHLAQCERPEYRIGVLLGLNSGGLCGLDCDDDAFAAEMLRLNPWLARTLTTACNRGCAFWLRLTDHWPKTVVLKWRGFEVGEWRADKVQSVIAGQDTKTRNWRRFVARYEVMPIPWRLLVWPEEMESGGNKHRHPWPPTAETLTRRSCATLTIGTTSAQIQTPEGVERAEDAERSLRSTSSPARSTSAGRKEAPEKELKQRRLYRELVSHLPAQAEERNALLNRAVPFLIHAVSEKLVLAFLMRHFDEKGKPGGWNGRRDDHQKSVESLIAGCLASYHEKLSKAERALYDRLTADDERAAFRICRDLAQRDDTKKGNPSGVFPMAYGELAARLDCSASHAEQILKRCLRDRVAVLCMETPGVPRAKGQPGIGTRWRWLSAKSAADEPF